MNLKNYLNELKIVIKEHYILILCFIVGSIILNFITIPFMSTLLMLILMFYISKTKDYKSGKLANKIFQFILFFIFVYLFVLLFIIPSTIFLLGYNIISTPEEFVNSPLISNFLLVGVYASMLFIFAPYRIFDANASVFKAISYSCSVIINNFLLFIIIAVFSVGINLLTMDISGLDYYIYLLTVVLTVTLYRLNVKQNLAKGDNNENN
jgi:hypothetical protein